MLGRLLQTLKSFLVIIFLVALPCIHSNNIYAGELKEEASSYREKGYEAQERGDIDSAINWYQKAASLDEDYATPHNDLGILFEAKGWLDRAESEYQKAISIDPRYAKAYTNFALIYERKGELEKAAYYWMKRYKLGKKGDPWTEEARKRLEKVGLLGDEAVKKKEKAEAKELFREREELPKKEAAEKTREKDTHGGWTRVGSGTKRETAEKPKTKKKARRHAKKKDFAKKPKEPSKKIRSSSARKKDIERELQRSLRLAEERLRKQKPKSPRRLSKNTAPAKKARKKKRFSSGGARSYYQKANSYYKKGEYSMALDTIRLAKKEYPDDAQLFALEQTIKNKMKEERIEDHYNEGILRYRSDDFSGARKEFEAILNILPE